MRDKTVSAILAHAAASFPEECCGVVIQKGRVEKYIPCKNNAESPTEQFELNHEDYAAAEEQGTVVAIVHSHPGDGATTQPSELDMLMCDATELTPHRAPVCSRICRLLVSHHGLFPHRTRH